MIDAETKEIIEWLESSEGLRWSRRQHRQNGYQLRMFCLKNDDPEADAVITDYVMGQKYQPWGRVNTIGHYVSPKECYRP